MLLRLQVEHDSLVMRAVSCLYHSPGHCAWQFLAVLPFGCVSLNTLWNIFCALLQGDDDPVGKFIINCFSCIYLRHISDGLEYS